MGVKLPDGSTVAIAATYLAAVAATAISNAAAAVVTAADHDFVAGDIVEITSGWSDISGRVARVASVTADSFTLGEINTTDVIRFPAGEGVGSVRKVAAFQQIKQILETASAGGEPNFVNFSFLEDIGDDRQLPSNRSASSMTLTVADDPTMPQTQILEAATRDREPRAIRWALPSGSFVYFGAYVSMSDMPTLTKGQIMANTVSLSKTGRATRYAGAQA